MLVVLWLSEGNDLFRLGGKQLCTVLHRTLTENVLFALLILCSRAGGKYR